MPIRPNFAAAAALLLLASQPGRAAEPPPERLVVDHDHTSVLFFVDHFGLSERNGRFSDVEGTLDLDRTRPERSVVRVAVRTASLSTGVPALDQHVQTADFLDVQRFPEAVFRSSDVRRTGPRTANVSGDLTLHGVTRPVVLKAVLTGVGENPATKDRVTGFRGEAVLRRSQFGITTFVPGVGDAVTLRIDVEFKASPAQPAAQ